MKQIICLQGLKNSGKDSVAEMLQYCLNTPSWMHKYWLYNRYLCRLYGITKQWRIVHYADKLKEVVATLLNVPVELLNDRKFKEDRYIDFTTLETFWREEITNPERILNDAKFNKEIKRLDMRLTQNYYLSVRQVLQFVGTNILRHYCGDNLWILHTLKSPHDKIIIADQRFLIENQIAEENNAFIIHITRPGTEQGMHPSESELQTLLTEHKYHCHIDNDGTLKDLFDKCRRVARVLKCDTPEKLIKEYV